VGNFWGNVSQTFVALIKLKLSTVSFCLQQIFDHQSLIDFHKKMDFNEEDHLRSNHDQSQTHSNKQLETSFHIDYHSITFLDLSRSSMTCVPQEIRELTK